jgi:tripeptidyl-peptidase-1
MSLGQALHDTMRSSSLAFHILNLALFCFSLMQAAGSNYERVEQLENVPEGWSRGSRPSASMLMTFNLAIIQSKAAEFEQKVVDLSTPGHATYGQHMTREEVNEFLRPHPSILDRVVAWLKSANVPARFIEEEGN